jgi:hypothetical protein
MLPIHSWTACSPRICFDVLLFLEWHRVKLIVEDVKVEEVALLVDLYVANRKFYEYYNVLCLSFTSCICVMAFRFQHIVLAYHKYCKYYFPKC